MLKIKTFADYQNEYKQSVENPEAFWEEKASHFTWRKKWDKVLNWNFKDYKIGRAHV